MAKLILKSPYLKPNRKSHAAHYVRYIATREGVDKPLDESRRLLPAAAYQHRIVEQALRDYPDTAELHEYADYRNNPTRENADEFIFRAAETHAELFDTRRNYVDYIANRPGAVRIAEHGLFTDADRAVVLEQVADEVSNHAGNVWTHIISLRREDAARLGYDNVAAWQDLLRRSRNAFAQNMKIRPENFRWYAAFHNADHHPHVHMVAFSSDPNEAWLSEEGISNIKSALSGQIFRQDLLQIYERQTERRDELRRDSSTIAARIVDEIIADGYDNPAMENLLLELADRLKHTSGKKVYGYLKADVKNLVDRIVDELACDERIAALYDRWYETRFDVLRTYRDTMPEKIPLSRQKDFKSIKNAVIAEAMRLNTDGFYSGTEDLMKPDRFRRKKRRMTMIHRLNSMHPMRIRFQRPPSMCHGMIVISRRARSYTAVTICLVIFPKPAVCFWRKPTPATRLPCTTSDASSKMGLAWSRMRNRRGNGTAKPSKRS